MRSAQERNRLGRLEGRSHRGGKGDDAACTRLFVAATGAATEEERGARADLASLAQRLVRTLGGVPAHRGHPVRVVVGELDSSLTLTRTQYAAIMGQSREQKTACLCGICKPVQRSATTDRTLVAGD
jgi:hypothetical protein